MGDKEVFEAFASTFIKPEYRDRFVHEAANKPDKLLARVCHNPDDLFEASLANGRCSYDPSESCLVLNSARGFRATTWAEASRAMGIGDGLLVIGTGGGKFYAETEASKGVPSVVFAGGS